MSGVEIVGLVLGAIPLFIAAAERYRDGLGFVRRAVRKQAFVAEYLDELTAQRTLLLLYLKAVVGKTDLLPSIQAKLIDDPQGPTWGTPIVVRALNKELGDAFRPFITLLTTICTTLAKQIREKDTVTSSAAVSDEQLLQRLQSLCLESEDKKNANEGEKCRIWDNIKFNWKHPQRLTMLNELKSYNESLEKLASAANRAKPYERKQQSRRVHKTFELRKDTERLYQALSKACTCRSLQQRTIGLGLGLAVHHTHSNEEDKDLSFEVVLFDAHDNAYTVAVKMVKSLEADPNTDLPPKKRVRIGFTPTRRKAGTRVDQMKRLDDICEEHNLAQASNCCLQLVVDEKDDLYSTNKKGTGQQPQQQDQSPAADSMLSICDVMRKFKLYDRKRWLHREKAILAVILAYSLLQIHHSSWWQSVWTSDSISFLGLEQSNVTADRTPDERIKLRRPFTRSVVAARRTAASTGSTRSAHLHALGIVLMELFLNQSIKDEVDAKDAGFDYRGAAQDLLDEHADDINMTAEYLRAVSFCLSPRPNPYSGSFSFEDRGFREMFYTEVISTLEDDLSSRFEVGEDVWAQDYV